MGYDNKGNVYFVLGALPGDVVNVHFPSHSRRYRDAELVSLVTSSPERVEPPCPHFLSCGGCDWQHWEYGAQLRGKEQILRHVLERSAFLPEAFLPILGAETSWGYRNRIQLHQKRGKIGFHKRRTHEIVEVGKCLLAHAKLNEALARMRDECLGDDETYSRRIELLLKDDGTVVQLADQQWLEGSFVQVNTSQNRVLQRVVSDLVLGAKVERVLELFCGNGNLTFSYCSGQKSVFAVDASREAVERASSMAACFGRDSVNFLCSFVDGGVLKKMPTSFSQHYDTLILDPPRGGLETSLNAFVHDGLRNIIYVSCSPLSFVKDVQCLKGRFSFRTVQPIDMFPHSRHIEFVSSFVRSF